MYNAFDPNLLAPIEHHPVFISATYAILLSIYQTPSTPSLDLPEANRDGVDVSAMYRRFCPLS